MGINVSKIQSILQTLVSTTQDLQGAALVTPDGLPLVTSLPSHMDDERVAAMSAAMLSLGERIGGELERGDVSRIAVESQEGHCVLTSCGEDALLLVLANQQAKQGILSLAIKQAVGDLKNLLF